MRLRGPIVNPIYTLLPPRTDKPMACKAGLRPRNNEPIGRRRVREAPTFRVAWTGRFPRRQFEMAENYPWSEFDIATLHSLWICGDSTTQIGHALGRGKNSIVGKVHRMAKVEPALWPPRPTPIRRLPQGSPPAPSSHKAKPRSPETALPPLPCLKERPFVDSAPPPPPVRPPVAPKAVPVAVVLSLLRCEMRDPNLPLRRADGSACLRILGDTKSEWRVCDAPLYSLTKPYCRSCWSVCVAKAREYEYEEEKV